MLNARQQMRRHSLAQQLPIQSNIPTKYISNLKKPKDESSVLTDKRPKPYTCKPNNRSFNIKPNLYPNIAANDSKGKGKSFVLIGAKANKQIELASLWRPITTKSTTAQKSIHSIIVSRALSL